MSGINGHGNEAQNRGVKPIMFGCKRRVAAIHCESVLGQVIGADGEEINFGCKHIRHQRRRWDFHHYADLH